MNSENETTKGENNLTFQAAINSLKENSKIDSHLLKRFINKSIASVIEIQQVKKSL